MASLSYLAFAALLACAAASDLLTLRIPNRLVLALVAAFAVHAVAEGLPADAIAAHLAAGAVTLALGVALFSAGWIGGGDAKLAAAAALWIGSDGLTTYLALAAIGGGLLALVVLLLRAAALSACGPRHPWVARLRRLTGGIPYGVALAGAAFLADPQAGLRLVLGPVL